MVPWRGEAAVRPRYVRAGSARYKQKQMQKQNRWGLQVFPDHTRSPGASHEDVELPLQVPVLCQHKSIIADQPGNIHATERLCLIDHLAGFPRTRAIADL
ncbi:hypothetical protein N7448_002911 [Penicillium atrosanguineum]|uniref:Uncharacterized protein n=1 Tax=Penicillium atrosanguineum TaxID=1132637 RepID=A0A9W9U3U8_9EURO|nr:uncharacterized protein N7443_001884 [Penicillium atrosanguineum]KAJ5121779.1 hypothetical protein N7526_008716 [Penicillium atrosanguineum]KAJ5139503.1 hypothetical protein N7448_002911 [Penicillium atrosanguineum]KAJ5309423.1 hypothetical protein N7443_001884 [Penicillium atrosanguineum]KAJ5314943.1 hypothetical protein N7476_005250 [Penicillium atrosanguineum]